MLEMTIESIRVSLMNYNRVVVLKEKDADRYLPIWIGAAEADAIAVRLQGVTVARPMTHDLITNLLHDMGAQVTRVLVCELSNDTFYARISLAADGRELEIDARPSDAIAVAVRSEVPIYVEEAVLDQAGVTLDEQSESEPSRRLSVEPTSIAGAEEIETMSAFREFIQGLDLDDFGEK